jgi:hypothetical protein
MEKEKKIQKRADADTKPNFLLWLIGIFIFHKIPFIFSVYYILWSLGLEDKSILIPSAIIIGHFATSCFDRLDEEVNDYINQNPG